MKYTRGFTVIELIVIILFVAAAGVLLIIQNNNLAAVQRDDQRKTAINAMYYNLEEVAYQQNEQYPKQISSEALPAMDPQLLTDPNDHQIGDSQSDYRYQPIDCDQTGCAGYTLRADLEKEADFVKTNRDD